MKSLYLIVPLAPLVGALIAGLAGKIVGRTGAHLITILGMVIATVASFMVLSDVMGGTTFNGTVYTWAVIDGVKLEVGFLIDSLTALMMVVVTFVSLMVHVYTIGYRQGFWRNAPWGFGVAALIVLQMWLVLSRPQWQGMTDAGPGIANADNIRVLGMLTFTEYVFPLQIAGVILLVAIIAAIALTLRGRKDSKSQDPSQQVQVKSEDRVRLVTMATEDRARQTKKA